MSDYEPELEPWRQCSSFFHRLPGQHVYDGLLFFGFSPPDTLDEVKEFAVRDDDVFVVTYPKAGTTWMQEIVWLIMHDGNFEEANKQPVYFRSPFLEFKDEILNEIGLELAKDIPTPRVIKSHLLYRLMPRQIERKATKVVVLFRNPKDLCVSYYHFYRSSSSMGNYAGSWEEFFEMFLSGYVDHGSWFEFTQSWWDQRHKPNILIVFYEDMKKDLSKEVKKISEFLGKPTSPDLTKAIVKHCSFASMRDNPMTNHEDVYSINKEISPLLRKGTVGDWKSHLTVAQNELFDYIYERKLGKCGLDFTYEL